MRKDNEQTREEKLLEAIGNLPEDMITKAAEYSPWQENAEEQWDLIEDEELAAFDASKRKNVFEKEEAVSKKETGNSKGNLYTIYRGIAIAACFALVIFAGSTGGKMLRNYLDKNADMSVKSGSVSGNASGNLSDDSKVIEAEPGYLGKENEDSKTAESEIVKGNRAEGNVADGLSNAETSLWANVNWYQEEVQKENIDTKNESAESKIEEQVTETVFKEGKTISLQVLPATDENGEEIPVITFGITGQGYAGGYSLHSQISNCKIISVTNQEQKKYIHLPDAEFAAGDVVELDTRQIAWASWRKGVVPEWKKTEITIFDILDISGYKEDGEECSMGRIVIGKHEEQYYGIYQKEYN